MEITTRPPPRGWRRAGVVLGGMALLIAIGLLVPAALGLRPHPLADDALAGPYQRGSLLYQEAVHGPGELRVGDVITFPAPRGSVAGTSVTRRVVAVDRQVAQTRGAQPRAKQWRVQLGDDEVERVVFAVPFAGLPQLLLSWLTWPMIAVLLGVAGIGALAMSDRAASRRRRLPWSAEEAGGPLLRLPPATEPMPGRVTNSI
jgi:hypothetical protein